MRVINVKKKHYFYSHTPGVAFTVPLTSLVIHFYPTRFMIEQKVYDLGLTGPIEKFTVRCDLERNKLIMHGHAQEGYFSVEFALVQRHVVAALKRAPLTYSSSLWKQGTLILGSHSPVIEQRKEVLFLGSHKAPNIDALLEKKHLESILPYLFLLGQGVEPIYEHSIGNLLLLKQCAKLAVKETKKEFLSQIKTLIASTFERSFVPKMYDNLHLGVFPSTDSPVSYCPSLLNALYQLLRQGLLKIEGSSIFILPFLSSIFSTGKALNLITSNMTLSFAWSCKKLRAVHLNVHQPTKISLHFPSGLAKGCIRKGAFGSRQLYKSSDPLFLKESGLYIIDRLER